MQAEYTYIAIFVLLGVFALLTILRLLRAAGNTIGQLRYESERDRYQHKRIEAERKRQFRALKRGSRKINGKAVKVHWDEGDRRASRVYHAEDIADEVFDDFSEATGSDVRTPWGWPASSGKRGGRSRLAPRPSASSRMRASASRLFRSKKVKDEDHKARQQRNIRALIEDRYGRVGHHTHTPDIEWSTPRLPAELIKEREAAQFFANKPGQDAEYGKKQSGLLRLVSDEGDELTEKRKASGE